MFADIVGYTALMENDETVANTLRNKFRNALKSLLPESEGRIIQFYGDGALLIFQSAATALEMAEALQRHFHADPEVPVRIGLHQGDITFDEEGAYGSAVNIAARIESLAATGSVLLSEKIYEEVENSRQLSCVSMGPFELKNVRRPIELYALKIPGLPVPNTSDLESAKARIDRKKTIAVLPFTNMSNDPENEYFSDGVTEEILNALTRVDGINVISRTSAFAFKKTPKDIRDIGKELGVAKILEGSVRKAGNQVRISAQLIDTADGYHIWSENYDHELENIFTVQDTIARKIAHKMKEHFEPHSPDGSSLSTSTTNIEAYKKYLQGLFYYNLLVPSETTKGIPFLTSATELDPGFVEAYNLLADIYINLGITGYHQHHDTFATARKYCHTALSLDPGSPEAAANMATIELFYTWQFQQAIERIREAKKRQPSHPKLHMISAVYNMIMGHLDEARDNVEQALDLDPLNIQQHRILGDIYYFKRDLHSAVKVYDHMLQIYPGNSLALEFKAWVTLMFGNASEALRIFQELKNQQNWTILPENRLACAKAVLGDPDMALSYLKEKEPEYKATKNGSLAVNIATIHRFLNNKEECLYYAGEAVDNRMSIMPFIKYSPLWDPIRDMPGFAKLCDKVFARTEASAV